uniref:RNA-directed RNA polymerase n=1 Tax=Cyrtomium ophiovirus TaxID=2983938 RepID=A0A9N7AAR2_9VIRU|nr:TPA_asm: polymerase [Cyrtomium ophiovirus]
MVIITMEYKSEISWADITDEDVLDLPIWKEKIPPDDQDEVMDGSSDTDESEDSGSWYTDTTESSEDERKTNDDTDLSDIEQVADEPAGKTEDKDRFVPFYNYIHSLGLSEAEYPYLYELCERLQTSHMNLMHSRKEESKFEPPRPKLSFKQEFKYLIPSIEHIRPTKQLPPEPIVKLDFPFVTFSKENQDFFLNSSMYPEKWSKTGQLDLHLFRSYFSNRDLEYTSSMKSLITMHNTLLQLAQVSVKSSKYWKFASALERCENNNLLMMYTNKADNSKLDNELSSTTLKASWVIDLFEACNFKVKALASNVIKNRTRTMKDSGAFHEGKRIKISLGSYGQWLAVIEVGKEQFKVYKSRTISAIEYDGVVSFGPGSYIDYLMTMADNFFTLNVIRDHASSEEIRFIDYIQEVHLHYNMSKRVKLAALYETTCLLMADFKGKCSHLPLLDNLYDTISIDKDFATKLFKIAEESKPETCIKMCSIYKSLIYAQVDHNGGLERYTQRTNRKKIVDKYHIERLAALFKMKMITNYIKKNKTMPNISNLSPELKYELDIMVCGGTINKELVFDYNLYFNVKLNKMLEIGNEGNIHSRVIDKACTTDDYHSNGYNSVKELKYYFDCEDWNVLPKSLPYTSSTNNRVCDIYDRKSVPISSKFDIVRLVEKEKELKEDPRFYGIASFAYKTQISKVMDMVKRAMKLLPGQMMTMNEDQRQKIMHDMSSLLREKDTYVVFLDYSGHNTSQTPDNTSFIMDIIANMYGYERGTAEYNEFMAVIHVFNNIKIISENTYTDYIYYSHGQTGAIEGWLGALWGIQSQLMMELMFIDMNIRKSICTTYSDDACAAFKVVNFTTEKMDQMIHRIQDSGLKMGLLIKLSQTQITDIRCSMLKNHYYKDLPIENTYKKMFSISPNSGGLWHDNLELVRNIDSGYTSSCLRSDNHRLQVIIRNFRTLCVVGKDIMHVLKELKLEFNPTYKGLVLHSTDKLMMHKKSIAVMDYSTVEDPMMWDLFPKDLDNEILFYHLHAENPLILKWVLTFFYLPHCMYGYSLTNIPDTVISGYSISNVKRITYVQSLHDHENKKLLSRLINYNDEACSYILNPVPLTGGYKDTTMQLTKMLSTALPHKCKNHELKEFLNSLTRKDIDNFMAEIVHCFANCFSYRIASKFYEESVFSFLEDIISKVDSSATLKSIVGKGYYARTWQNVWESNHHINVKLTKNEDIINYNELIRFRNMHTKSLKGEGIELIFLPIEEVPLLGQVHTDSLHSLFEPIMRGKETITKNGPKRNPPSPSSINSPKFDRELGIESLFRSKLVFQAFEITRYTKWLIFELVKYSTLSDLEQRCLISACDCTLSTFTEARYADLEPYTVAPIGGRYFHRSTAGGFNPKTGDLTSQVWTGRYELAGLERLNGALGGEDNNLNLQYLMVSTRVILGYNKVSPQNLRGLTLNLDICHKIRDVSFTLMGIRKAHALQHPIRLESSSLIDTAPIYKSYTQYLLAGATSTKDFIGFAMGRSLDIINVESNYKQVYKYMSDQNIISPEIINKNDLEAMVPQLKKKEISFDDFFDGFYTFYSSCHVMGKESSNGSLIRSLIFKELFKKDKDGEMWSRELMTAGFSMSYRNELLRVFIIACGLVFVIQPDEFNKQRLSVNHEATMSNSVRCFRALSRRQGHFYIKDKVVSQILLNAFPTLSYSIDEVEFAALELADELDNMIFEQVKLYEYFNKENLSYITVDRSIEYGLVNYTSVPIGYHDLSDLNALRAGIKAMEYICSLAATPLQYSSPTKSDVYPSAKGILNILVKSHKIKKSDRIVDFCAGRGDFHVAMEDMNISHTSISRNDGYNLVNRIAGMVTKKEGWNAFEHSSYIDYCDHDVMLFDVSHITGKKQLMNKAISELILMKKRIIIRMNTITEHLNEATILMISKCEAIMYIPERNSPGILYLYINGNKRHKVTKVERDKTGFQESILYQKLLDLDTLKSAERLIPTRHYKVKDHTEEFISDDQIMKELLVPGADDHYISVSQGLKDSIKSSIDLRTLMAYPLRNQNNIYEGLTTVDFEFIVSEHSMENSNYDYASDILKEYMTTGNTRYLVTLKQSEIFPTRWVTGFENMSAEDLSKYVQQLMGMRLNDHTKEVYGMLASLAGKGKISSDIMVKQISIESLRTKGIGLTMDTLYTTMRQAVLAWKSGRTREGLIAISGLNSRKLRNLMQIKTKTNRVNIMNYKLLINRIRRLSSGVHISHKRGDVTEYLKEHIGLDPGIKPDSKEVIELINKYQTAEKLLSELWQSSDNFFSFVQGKIEAESIDFSISRELSFFTEEKVIEGFFTAKESITENEEIERKIALGEINFLDVMDDWDDFEDYSYED